MKEKELTDEILPVMWSLEIFIEWIKRVGTFNLWWRNEGLLLLLLSFHDIEGTPILSFNTPMVINLNTLDWGFNHDEDSVDHIIPFVWPVRYKRSLL